MASFTVGPQRRVPPSSPEVRSERAAPVARSLSRTARVFESTLVPAGQEPRVQVRSVDADLPELVVETARPDPEPTDEPAREPTPPPQPTPAPAPPTTPRPAAPVVSPATGASEARMLLLINASRAAAGLAPLVLDANVAAVARAHSAAEARVGYVYHDGVDGTAASRNTAACGSGWYGENTGKVYGGNVDALHYEFMSEPWAPINHRTNIMDPNFRRIGVGAAVGADAMYMTMVFCR